LPMSTYLKLNLISQCLKKSSPKGRDIVLEILESSSTPLLPRDIWEIVRKKYAGVKTDVPNPPMNDEGFIGLRGLTPPPFPKHPIRSMGYLKSIILHDLENRKLVEKIHFTREPTPEELELSKLKKKKKNSANRPEHLQDVATVLINSRGLVDMWGWRLLKPKTPEEIARERERIQNAREGQLKLNRKKWAQRERVDFLEEWGHLNVRRQRTRKEKLVNEGKFAAMLEESRALGRRDAEAKQAELHSE